MATFQGHGHVFQGSDRIFKSTGPAFSLGWSQVGAGLIGRSYFGSAQLADGRTVIAGGEDNRDNEFRRETEIISADGTSVSVHAGLSDDVNATMLATMGDGRVLRVGGQDLISSLATTETFDLGTLTWTVRASAAQGLIFHWLTTLADGKVLRTGGLTGTSNALANTIQVFDYNTNLWSSKATMNTARFAHAAVLLQDGRVFVVGGSNNVGTFAPTSAVEIYDPAGNSWTTVTSCPDALFSPSAIVLPDGRVLVGLGVNGSNVPFSNCYIYDVGGNSWTTTASMNTPRRYVTEQSSFGFMLRSDGRVQVAGGQTASGADTTASEIYDPSGDTWAPTFPLARSRFGGTVCPTLTPDQFLYIGGAHTDPDTDEFSYLLDIERN